MHSPLLRLPCRCMLPQKRHQIVQQAAIKRACREDTASESAVTVLRCRSGCNDSGDLLLLVINC